MNARDRRRWLAGPSPPILSLLRAKKCPCAQAKTRREKRAAEAVVDGIGHRARQSSIQPDLLASFVKHDA